MDPRAGGGFHVAPRKFLASVRERLVAFAAHQFSLARLVDGKTTRRKHLLAAARRGSQEAKQELAGPPCPAGAEYVWGWFLALDAARASSGFGASALAWSELEAFCRLNALRMSAPELDLVRALDRARLSAADEGGPP